MELAPAGVPLSFEVTYDSPSLDVGMTVYDDSGITPTLLEPTFAMDLVAGNTYRGKFSAANNKSYIIIKAVYTDPTLTTVDDNYSQGSESIVAQTLSGGSGGSSSGSVVGIVDNDTAVVGVVNC